MYSNETFYTCKGVYEEYKLSIWPPLVLRLAHTMGLKLAKTPMLGSNMLLLPTRLRLASRT